MSIKEAWEAVLHQVREAVDREGHPFRYVTLATVDQTNAPRQRTVVLRDFDVKGSAFTVFTDCRSAKISQITENDAVSLHFYDDEKRLQLIVAGTARIVNSGQEYRRRWEESGSSHGHSYTSVVPPGTEISHPEEAYEWHSEDSPNFCIMHIEADEMEFLQLDGVKHIRGRKTILSDKKEVNRWIAP